MSFNGIYIKSLAEITDLVIDYRGKTPKKLGGDWAKSGYKAISAKNVKTGKIVNEKSIRFVDEKLYKKWMKDEIEKGDILITSEAPFGEIYYWNSSEKIVLSQRLFGLRIKKEISSKYIYYYLTTKKFNGELKSRATGTTVMGLRQPELLKCKVAIPDVNTQKKIASILSSLDDKIELNNKINKNLEEMAQAIFKSWFVDFEPWGGKQPNNWQQSRFGDFGEIKRGGSPRPIKDFLSETGFSWLKISDATGLKSPFILNIKEHIKKDGLKKTVFLKSGSLVLSNSATPGIPKILCVDTCIHDGWLYFPSSYFSNEYLYLFFKIIRKELVSLGNGSVFTNLKTDILKNYSVIVPKKKILKDFDGLVQPLFSQIECNAKENNKLTRLRDTLLPKLMSGELDVSNLDIK